MPPVQSSPLGGVHLTPQVARKYTNGTSKPPPDADSENACVNSVGWNVTASDRSIDTVNPIRQWVQELTVTPNPDKDLIKLSVGDPTLYGNLRVNPEYIEEYCRIIRSGKYNGYAHSMGLPQARQAVAERYSLSADDVFLTTGASGALELAIVGLDSSVRTVLRPDTRARMGGGCDKFFYAG